MIQDNTNEVFSSSYFIVWIWSMEEGSFLKYVFTFEIISQTNKLELLTLHLLYVLNYIGKTNEGFFVSYFFMNFNMKNKWSQFPIIHHPCMSTIEWEDNWMGAVRSGSIFLKFQGQISIRFTNCQLHDDHIKKMMSLLTHT